MEKLLDKIDSPFDLKKLTIPELKQLSEEIRNRIISAVSKTGGHLASSLGAVEIAVALHYIFDSPSDKIIWDVGHQAYAHKILTGRNKDFDTLRQFEGVSGFPKRTESPHDVFGTGHSSTSISAALGFVKARDLSGLKQDVIAVIGDGALTGGIAFEALNNAGHLGADLIVILNDNEMSIAKNVGAVATYLSKLRMQPQFVKARSDLRSLIKNIPAVGKKLLETAEGIESHINFLLVPGVLFEALGFTYLGPFDGHNLEEIIPVLKKVKNMSGPRLVHLLTQKGKGYTPAEEDQVKFHGAIPFDVPTGQDKAASGVLSYTQIFGETLIQLAKKYQKIIAITAAMPDGTGLVEFAKEFPQRFFDVGIAEQHAVTFAGGLAAAGFKPVLAVYSSFLQRAYDQVIHDVCLQNLPVVFAIDRGGLVGEDGPTHHGTFDLSFLRTIPNIIIMAPKDENELRHMLKTAIDCNSPVAVRYPRGKGVGVKLDLVLQDIPIGKAEVMTEGKDVLFLAVGSMVYPCLLAAEELTAFGLEAQVVNMRFVKPLDKELIINLANKFKKIFTFEENAVAGGFGTAVLELLAEKGLKDIDIKCVGLPDKFIEHGSLGELKEKYNLTAKGIVETVKMSLSMV